MIGLIILLQHFMILTNSIQLDFGAKKAGQDWQIINDGVMGGLSDGTVEFKETSVYYKGNISLANNGGFSSFRSPYAEYNLSSFKTVKVRYRSKGQTVAFQFEDKFYWWQTSYRTLLPTTDMEWKEVLINLEELDEQRLLKKTGAKINSKSLAKIIRMGFITIDKKEGPFEMEIDYLSFE